MQNNGTVWIGTPMYGGMCTAQYMKGVIHSLNVLSDRGIQTHWQYLVNESLITRGRNFLVQRFLESGYDYLMFIDSDIEFMGEDILTLLDSDKDIICGIYPKKEIDWFKINQAAKNGVERLGQYGGAFVLTTVHKDLPPVYNGIMEIKYGGTGFMLIKRSVFEKLAPHVPTYRSNLGRQDGTGEFIFEDIHEFFATSIDVEGTLLSEDYHFCKLWRTHGGQVFANLKPKLNHVGHYVYTGDYTKSGFNIK